MLRTLSLRHRSPAFHLPFALIDSMGSELPTHWTFDQRCRFYGEEWDMLHGLASDDDIEMTRDPNDIKLKCSVSDAGMKTNSLSATSEMLTRDEYAFLLIVVLAWLTS